MAHRKAGAQAWAVLFLVAVPIYLAVKLYDFLGNFGIAALLIAAIALLISIIFYKARQRQKALATEQNALLARQEFLMTKYGDPAVVSRIIARDIWLGQTAEQLKDALSQPVAVDNQQLKTKKKEVWKYHPRGVNRYALRVTLENDAVIGWEQKE